MYQSRSDHQKDWQDQGKCPDHFTEKRLQIIADLRFRTETSQFGGGVIRGYKMLSVKRVNQRGVDHCTDKLGDDINHHPANVILPADAHRDRNRWVDVARR